jgi:hypothetical protein
LKAGDLVMDGLLAIQSQLVELGTVDGIGRGRPNTELTHAARIQAKRSCSRSLFKSNSPVRRHTRTADESRL